MKRRPERQNREMTSTGGVLFVPYQETLGLLGVEDALRVCEDVYAMHARGRP